jgi:tellurite resistance protein TerA
MKLRPNWEETDAVVTLTIPGQPTLELRLDSRRNDQRMCALVMLEDQSDNIKVTKLVEHVADHRCLDQAYGLGLRWVARFKDWFFSTRFDNFIGVNTWLLNG